MPGFFYLIPVIFSLPPGHRILISVPPDLLRRRLKTEHADVTVIARAFIDGETVWSETNTVSLSRGEKGGQSVEFSFDNDRERFNGAPGFMEIEFLSAGDEAIFSKKAPPELYGLYSRPGCQGFRADGSYKFGVPSVIASVTKYKTFVESFQAIDIDLMRDRFESVTLLNPYSRPLVVTLSTVDGRQLPRVKVPAKSVIWVSLEGFLRDDETSLKTRLQLMSTNRVVSYHVRHSGGTEPIITDHEHLDIYRADPTHSPITLYWRDRLARVVSQHFGFRL